MNRIAAICLSAAVLLALQGCGKEKIAGDDAYISFGTSFGATKALLGADDLSTGTTLTVYDILSSAGYARHIDGKTATMGASDWSITGPADEPDYHYPWQYADQFQDHNFFAWMTRDKDDTEPTIGAAPMFSSAPAFSNPSPGIYKLETPEVDMRFNMTQFDFCYSGVTQRTADSHDYSQVPLQMEHLFTSLGIKVKNYSMDPVTIKSLVIYGLDNIKKAEITWNANTGETSVNYVHGTGGSEARTDAAGALSLVNDVVVPGQGEVMNVINSYDDPTDREHFFLFWPQTHADLNGTGVKGNPGFNCQGTIELSMQRVDEATPTTYTIPLIPQGADANYGWNPGERHLIELGVRGKSIDLKVTPLPWDYEERTIDVTQPAAAANPLTIEGGIADNTKKEIYFNGARPIHLKFKLTQPENATWIVQRKGDIEAFEIDNVNTGKYGDGINNTFGPIDGTEADVTIYPTNLNPIPGSVYKVSLSFVVRTADGEITPVDNVVYQGSSYTTDWKIVQRAL